MNSQKRFRFGVTGLGQTRAQWQDFARKAEDLGYSTLLMPDHFGRQFALVPGLLAAASVTTRLRIGSFVIDNDFRNPALLAKEAATLDVMTDGRFELGLGAGWLPDDYRKSGVVFESPSTRLARLTEALHIVKAFFREPDSVTFHGQHYHIDGLDAAPKPIQQPHPPILIGASSPRMLALAGREADILSVQMRPIPGRSPLLTFLTSDGVEQQLSIVRQAAGERFANLEINVLSNAQVTDDQKGTAERLAQRMETTPQAVLDMPALYVGSVDAIVDQLQERRERLGISYPVIFGHSIDAFAPVVARLAGT